MSLIIALKDKGHVYIGADSMSSKYGDKYKLNIESNRVFKLKNTSHVYMGLDSKVIETNVAKYNEVIPEDCNEEDINLEFVFNVISKNLFQLFSDYNLLQNDDGRPHCSSDMIIATKDSLYEIGTDSSVIEHEEFCASGCGSEIALGSLITTKKESDPIKRMAIAFKAAEKHKTFVSYPFFIINTMDGEIHTINKEDI